MSDDPGAELPSDITAEDLLTEWERDGRKSASSNTSRANDQTEEEKQTQKEHLLGLAEGHYLFTDERDRPFVWLQRDGHQEVVPLDSARFKNWLAYRFYQLLGTAPSASSLSEVLGVLMGQARFEGRSHELGNRLARDEDGELWYDLTDDAWRAVRITADGWRVEEDAPLLFRRYSHQELQVTPSNGFSNLRDELSPFLNLSTDSDELLVLVWLVTALLPDIPRAILVPHGPQGSAKSTLTRMLRRLVDPSSVPMPRFPRGDAEMAQVLDHNAACFFDNVSSISDAVSDTLCRAVTGDGFSKRKLYSDDDDVLYSFRRLILLNGINVPAQKPDLLDRCILVRLDRIGEEERRDEREFWKAFEEARPRIFGAMLDALVKAIPIEANLKLDSVPRMADWARCGFAVAEALGFGGEEFLAAYRANRAAQNEEALAAHPVGATVKAFMVERDEWAGSATELLEPLEQIALVEKIDTKQKDWPKSANWLARRMNEVETNLQEAGIHFERQRGTSRRLRLWKEAVGNVVDSVDADVDLTGSENEVRRQPAGIHVVPDDADGAIAPPSKGFDDNDSSDGISQTSLFDELDADLATATR